MISIKIQLDGIYDRLYSLNESLSIYESKQLMKGFEDGIKEGWGDWIGKTAAKAKKVVTGTYNKGKNLAKKAWVSIKEFANEVYTTINNAYKNSIDYITSAPGKIKNILNNAYESVIEKVTSALEALKDKADELKQAINTIYDNVAKKAIQAGKDAVAKIVDAKVWLKNNYEIVKQSFIDAKNSTITWIKEAGIKGLEVLKKIGSGTLKVASVIGFIVAGLIILPTQLLIKSGIMLYNTGVDAVNTGAEYVKTAVTNANNYLKKEFSDIAKGYQEEMAHESYNNIKSFNQFINS